MLDNELKDEMARVAGEMRRTAERGVHIGQDTLAARFYITRCRRVHHSTQTVLIFTRDAGHHSSGWMKNPDYERCWHLSTSPAPSRLILPGRARAELDRKVQAAWLDVFFGAGLRYVWSESPKTPQGKAQGVWHWRLFCDSAWRPLKPRGEVYSTELTELGWRSASQVLEEDGVLVTSVLDPS